MAVAAETLPPNYIAADSIAEVAVARQQVRTAAWDTIAERRAMVVAGQGDAIPLSVDTLTTAEKVLAAAEAFGEESDEYRQLSDALELDFQRYIAEWHRKIGSEYFDEIYHEYDAETEDFYSHGLSIRQMTENALVPHLGDPEEEARRVNERVEDATPQILRAVGHFALDGLKVRTISECTDSAIASYAKDQETGAKHRGYRGYVPEIEKLMIRDWRLDNERGGRYEEQFGMPGLYVQHAIIQEAISRRGLDVADKDKTALHGTQVLVRDDLIEFVALLDEVASEQWCTPIFLGEQVAADHPKNYDSVRQEARQRQAGLKDQARAAALFVKELAAQKTDRRKAPAIVEEFVKKLLFTMVRDDLSLAPQMFDERTAEGLRQVVRLESIGRLQEAAELYLQVEAQAPGGGACGAGSCGLEAIFAGSEDEAAVKELGFGNAKDVIKDTERTCVHCNKKSVYYDTKQGKKGCTSCHKTAKY